MDGAGSRLLFEEIVDLSPAQAATRIRGMIGEAETGQLDFKRKADDSRAEWDDEDKKNYAKAISGFSNSDGGLVIWGVDARKVGNDPELPDVVQEFYPIANVEAFATHLTSQVRWATTPVAHRVENRAVVEDPDTGTGFCLTWVPVGDSPPYRRDYHGISRYYKRGGSDFYEMEPYDIRDVIFRFHYPKVDIDILPIGDKASAGPRRLRVRLTNKGPVTLRGFKFVVEVPWSFGAEGDRFREVDPPRVRNEEDYRVLSVKSILDSALDPARPLAFIREPVYPGDTVDLGNLTCAVNPQVENRIASKKFKIFWTLYGDNMPPLSGECDAIGLISQ